VRKQNSVSLKEKERKMLQELISKSKEKARALTRCRILLLTDKGETDSKIIEALAGHRTVKVTEQKTKKDYAEFMKELASYYADAVKIILVQDNLNTHNPSSFYEVFDAPEAFALSQRFEMVYTPKKASWLNMAEIELSALSKQCLDRSISQMHILTKEVTAWSRKRNHLQTKITWQFTKSKAREKLSRFYDNIRN